MFSFIEMVRDCPKIGIPYFAKAGKGRLISSTNMRILLEMFVWKTYFSISMLQLKRELFHTIKDSFSLMA